MANRLPPSLALFVVGLLLGCGGLILIVGPLLFAAWVAALPLCWPLGAVMVLAGIGLCRARTWAWYLALGIVVTGLAVVLWRLLANGAAEWPVLSGALITDAVIAIVLLRAHPQATQVPSSI